MNEKRINVGLLEGDHSLAGTACGLTSPKETLQDFVTKAARTRAEQVIKDFKSGKSHSRRDNREAHKKQS